MTSDVTCAETVSSLQLRVMKLCRSTVLLSVCRLIVSVIPSQDYDLLSAVDQ